MLNPLNLLNTFLPAQADAEPMTEAATEAAAEGGVAETPPTDFSDPQVWIDLGTEYGPKIGLALAILLIGLIVASWVASITDKAMTRAKVDTTLSKFFAKMAKYGVMLLVFLSVLSTLGVETTSFAAVIAAMGFAVGLALQGTLSNFSSGVMLLFFRPFRVGQFVKVAGEAGVVDAIGLFTTTLDTVDNRRVILPNSNVFGNTIENVSHHEDRRVEVAVGTDYGADLDKTREVLLKAIDSLGEKINKADAARQPQVFLAGLGDSAIDWRVRAWVKAPDYWDVMDGLTRAVKIELDNAGIGIPFPQQDVHLFKQN